MLTTVRQKPWQKTQLWGLYKTQDGSLPAPTRVPQDGRVPEWLCSERSLSMPQSDRAHKYKVSDLASSTNQRKFEGHLSLFPSISPSGLLACTGSSRRWLVFYSFLLFPHLIVLGFISPKTAKSRTELQPFQAVIPIRDRDFLPLI